MNIQEQCKKAGCKGWNNPLICGGVKPCPLDEKAAEMLKKEKRILRFSLQSRILKIWMNNQRNIMKKSIAVKYAKYVHVGQKRAMQEFPIIKQILKNQNIRRELRLSEDETNYLDKPLI